MIPRGDDRENRQERYQLARVIGLATTLPFLLVAAPLVGLFGGQWLDAKIGAEPWFKRIGLVLGLIAGAHQTYLASRRLMREFDH